jgi:hypothetical protein
MMTKVIVNRWIIESEFGGRGGIDRDLGFAIADALLGAKAESEGTFDVLGGDGTWDYRRGRGRAEASCARVSIVVESLRSPSGKTWWLESATPEQTAVAEVAAQRCLSRWGRHCELHSDDIRSSDPVDVGFDPAIHTTL